MLQTFTMKLRNTYYLLFLSAIVGYVYDIVLDGVALARGNLESSSPMLRGMGRLDARVLDSRLLAVVKETWTECVDQRLSAIDCKEFIDEEILTEFTGIDKFIQTKIVGKRNGLDEYYNAVVIPMDDDHMVVGRDGDGQVIYDFVGDSSAMAVTPEEDAAIPPIVATETIEDAEALAPTAAPPTLAPAPETDISAATPPAYDDGYLPPVPPPATSSPPPPPPPASSSYASSLYYDDDGAASYTQPVTAPATQSQAYSSVATTSQVEDLFLLDEEVTIEGATLEEAIAGTTKPIAGGVLTSTNATDTPEGEAKLLEALSQPDVIPEALPRILGPFDCSGLTGPSCCLLVKKKVRDLDKNHKAIQCFMDFAEGTVKKNIFKNLHKGKKVIIYANHNNMVSRHPTITGNWEDVTYF